MRTQADQLNNIKQFNILTKISELENVTTMLHEELKMSKNIFKNSSTLLIKQQNETNGKVADLKDNAKLFSNHLNITMTKLRDREEVLNKTISQQQNLENMLNNTNTMIKALETNVADFKKMIENLDNSLTNTRITLTKQQDRLETLNTRILLMEAGGRNNTN